MSRESKIEQIRKQSIQSLNEERLKRLHKEYKNAPFVSEAKKATGASAAGAAAAGAGAGGGSGITTSPYEWKGDFTKQFIGGPGGDPEADSKACNGSGGYTQKYYSESGIAFQDGEIAYTDVTLKTEVTHEARLGLKGDHSNFYFYDDSSHGGPFWWEKRCH